MKQQHEKLSIVTGTPRGNANGCVAGRERPLANAGADVGLGKARGGGCGVHANRLRGARWPGKTWTFQLWKMQDPPMKRVLDQLSKATDANCSRWPRGRGRRSRLWWWQTLACNLGIFATRSAQQQSWPRWAQRSAMLAVQEDRMFH
ncbi:hypothetical protein CPLU01_00840 [Colletotrichum plurivorum]|uniref:Uncharacterized protein n=1 Tax=Colletotrichum plurivorum TaxID=2175906 RepID=A0A8H6NQT6_9PEZI|nr:hypothetical protein CPLU01_00840 [Colletotrichum plurivorum]